MGRRGRVSSASLAILPGGEGQRPEPPADLTEEQAGEWRAIVARCPVDWFPRETHALLAQLCCHVASARWIAKLMNQIEAQPKPNLKVYEKLRRAREAESKAINTLARAMRLSQHATYDKKKSKGPTAPPPWED